MLSYHEIRFVVACKSNLDTRNYYEKISNGINFCMMNRKETKELHLKNGYKGYSFYIREQLPIKTGSLFHLIMRCYGDNLSAWMKECLLQKDNDYFFCQNVDYDREYTYHPLVKRLAMKTVSPVVITNLWDDFSDGTKVVEYIGANINKKYNSITGETQWHNPVSGVVILGNKICVTNYKSGCIAGRKVLVVFKDDELSQKMAFVAMAYGLGEKNTLGFGTCFANNEYIYEYNKLKGDGGTNG